MNPVSGSGTFDDVPQEVVQATYAPLGDAFAYIGHRKVGADLTERETAEVLGIAVGTVKSQARDGLARLRDLVPGLGLDDDATLAPATP